MRQAEAAARAYERPLALLFVPEPPEEEPTDAQFRRLPGAPSPPWPPEMRLLARRVRDRQDAAVELYDLLAETPPWTEVELPELQDSDVEDPEAIAEVARELLGIALEEQRSWQDRSGYAPLRAWVDAVEACGVLVMQDGSLPREQMRGFASLHPQVPAIVVNTKDEDPRARAFTVVHEFGHLLRAHAGVSSRAGAEEWCNDFAGGVLMPRDDFQRGFQAAWASDLLQTIDRVALNYGITPYAAAVRASRLQVAPERLLDDVIDRIRGRGAHGRQGGQGGNYYRNQIARLGPAFVELVFVALDTGTLSHGVAAGLLREKVNHLPTLREYLVARR